MAEIILLRHGQASFGADNYDQLSELGHSQCLWLGEYLQDLGRQCDRVAMGAMDRHHQTAQAVLRGLQCNLEPMVNPGFNEYDFQGLLTPLREQFPDEWVETGHSRRDYFHNMKRALGYWMSGAIENDGKDSWSEFCERIHSAFDEVCQGDFRRLLIISSGGPIAVILARVLRLDHQRICDMTVQIKNSSISTLLYNRVDLTLDSFNDVSHLQTPERLKHITFS